MSEATVIKVSENGPYLVRGSVKGSVRMIDADGTEYDLSQRSVIALCRCGGSMTKPFCDGTHSRQEFEAPERAVAAQAG